MLPTPTIAQRPTTKPQMRLITRSPLTCLLVGSEGILPQLCVHRSTCSSPATSFHCEKTVASTKNHPSQIGFILASEDGRPATRYYSSAKQGHDTPERGIGSWASKAQRQPGGGFVSPLQSH